MPILPSLKDIIMTTAVTSNIYSPWDDSVWRLVLHLLPDNRWTRGACSINMGSSEIHWFDNTDRWAVLMLFFPKPADWLILCDFLICAFTLERTTNHRLASGHASNTTYFMFVTFLVATRRWSGDGTVPRGYKGIPSNRSRDWSVNRNATINT